jgi:hypothetical protein
MALGFWVPGRRGRKVLEGVAALVLPCRASSRVLAGAGFGTADKKRFGLEKTIIFYFFYRETSDKTCSMFAWVKLSPAQPMEDLQPF